MINRYKRFCLLLAVVFVLPLLLCTQTVEARRGIGFSASDSAAALYGLASACVDGVEFSFTLDDFAVFSDPVIIIVAATLMPQDPAQIAVTGPFTQTFMLNRHDPVPLENTYDGYTRAIVYSANDSIPDGNGGNIRLTWSDFGLSTPTPGDHAALTFSAVNATSNEVLTSLSHYLNDGGSLGNFMIEACKGDVFPAPPPTCVHEKVYVRGQELPIPVSAGFYRQPIQPNVSSGLQASSVDLIGRVKREFPPAGSRYPAIDLLVPGESSGPTWAPDSVSPAGYIYSHEWVAASGFAPITLAVEHNEAKTYAYPKHLVFYDTYASSVKAINVVRPLSRFVDDARGFNTALEHFAFPRLEAPTTINVTAIYIDNQVVSKPIRVGAAAGGVTATQTTATPNIGSGLNLIELTLHDVPRGTSALDFTIESPVGTGDAALLTGLVVSYPCLAPADNVAPINETQTAPLIDGATDEVWSSAAKYPIAYLLEGAGPVAAADVSGYFQGLYDSNHLYLLVEVFDDDLRNDSGREEYLDDEIEIHLDGNNSQQTTYDKVDDLLYIFRWNDPVLHLSFNSVAAPAGVQWQLVDTATGYRLELALPALAVGLTPSPNYEFGIEVQISDDDGGGDRDHKKSWNAFVDDVWSNPSRMGIGRLIGNRPPVANPDVATVNRDETLFGTSLLANDGDPDGDPLTINPTTVRGPGNGSLVIHADGTYVYTPTLGFVGNDLFTYIVADDRNGHSTADVTIAVTTVLATNSRQVYLPFIVR